MLPMEIAVARGGVAARNAIMPWHAFWLALCAMIFIPEFARAQSIPETFRGVWQQISEGRDCRQSDWDGPAHTDTLIRVQATQVEYIEASCKVASVKVDAEGTARMQLSCAGEGETFRNSEVWSVQEFRGYKLLVTTRLEGRSAITIIYQNCAGDRASAAPSGERQGTTPSFQALPEEIRAYVRDVRGRCRAHLDEFPKEERQGLKFIPDDEMQGIITGTLDGRPAIIADNLTLCNDHLSGVNCSNRGCDVVIWRQDHAAVWRKIFSEHLHERNIEVDQVSRQMKSIKLRLYAGDPRCRPAKNVLYTSGQSCALTAQYSSGVWKWMLEAR